jgi:hypothetical protein
MMAIPDDVRLGDLVPTALKITRGYPTQRGIPEGHLPVMSVAALRNQTRPKFFADPGAQEDLQIGVAQPGDVLVSIEGGTVGEVLVVPEDAGDFVPSQQIATLRIVDTGRLDSWYLGAWLSTERATKQLRRLARGAGIQRIPIKELSTVAIQIPSLAKQKEIGERFRGFDEAIRSHRAVTACLEELRDLDLVMTFAGEANVNTKSRAAVTAGRRDQVQLRGAN